jgi:putative DNA primase/helicase
MELTGKGGAGKSTYMALCCAIVGDANIISTSLRALETSRFETATIKDKKLVLMADSECYCGPAAVLKAMTGGDPLPYEEKHRQKTRSFIFTGLALLVANETIAFEDYTSGITRRRIALNIEKLVTEAEKRAWTKAYGHDKLTAAVFSELPQIINWVLAMSEEEMEDILIQAGSLLNKETYDALLEQNPIAAWIEACCLIDPEAETAVGACGEIRVTEGTRTEDSLDSKAWTEFEQSDTHLYPNYCQWCTENGKKPVSTIQFAGLVVDLATTLGYRAIKYRKNKGMFIKGLRLLEGFRSWKSAGMGERV